MGSDGEPLEQAPDYFSCPSNISQSAYRCRSLYFASMMVLPMMLPDFILKSSRLPTCAVRAQSAFRRHAEDADVRRDPEHVRHEPHGDEEPRRGSHAASSR